MSNTSSHPELCVGAIVIRDASLLVIRRGRGAGVGMWSVPGGRVELGETMEAAVVRELSEETGLAGRVLRYLGWVERIGHGYHFVIHDYLVDVDVDVDGDTATIAGDDAADVGWIALDELEATSDLVPGLVEFLREHSLMR
jgi:8-oxo-dGTP diphosphatase